MFDLQKSTGFNFFATSRFIPDITKRFEADSTLEIRASDQDVQRYLNGRMLRLPLFVQRNPEIQKVIEAEIVEVVDGM